MLTGMLHQKRRVEGSPDELIGLLDRLRSAVDDLFE